MAINFPDSPTTGDKFTDGNGQEWMYNGELWHRLIATGSSVAVSDTPPSTPADGDQWYDSKIGLLATWYEDGDSGQWVSDALVNQANSAVVGNRVLQRRFISYDPPSAQNLSTSFQDILGSSYNFTPESATSEIEYDYSFFMTNPTLANVFISSFRMVVDGVPETNSNFGPTASNGGGVSFGGMSGFRMFVSSWGTTPKIMKVQGRAHDAVGTDTKLFETTFFDGAGQALLMKAYLKITEYTA